LFGEGDDEHYSTSAQQLGIRTIVLKRAERGALAIHDGERFEAAVVKAERVVDPVGLVTALMADSLRHAYAVNQSPPARRRHCGRRFGGLFGDYAGYPSMDP
jgi:hypothetical protein